MYKVFSKASSIIINSSDKNFIKDYKSVLIENEADMHKFTKNIFSDNITGDYQLYSNSNIDVLELFKSQFDLMLAAGGVVNKTSCDERLILFIKRMGYWDFPKGKIEKNESIQTAALREVMEETMIDKLEITRELPASWHIYKDHNKWILKKTYWFEMFTSSEKKLIPQTEEDIELAEWKKFSNAEKFMNKSYRSLRECFKDYFNY